VNEVGVNIRLLETSTRGDRLAVEVPTFKPGPYPPSGDTWEHLLPEQNRESDLPIFTRELLIRDLVRDEIRFRGEHQSGWFERCWFVFGLVQRDPDGNLWGWISRLVPTVDVKATRASFEFAPGTWWAQRKQVERTGEMLLGWIHTHSLESLEQAAGTPPEFPVSNPSQEMSGGRVGTQQLRSGLFLSFEDIQSARKCFSAAYHLSGILDSDACLQGENGRLEEVFGVWGWIEGCLCRRSIHLVKETHRDQSTLRKGEQHDG
jgi:hypothetical protein